jgi:hypothetical protein
MISISFPFESNLCVLRRICNRKKAVNLPLLFLPPAHFSSYRPLSCLLASHKKCCFVCIIYAFREIFPQNIFSFSLHQSLAVALFTVVFSPHTHTRARAYTRPRAHTPTHPPTHARTHAHTHTTFQDTPYHSRKWSSHFAPAWKSSIFIRLASSFAFTWITSPDSGTPIECTSLNQVLMASPNQGLFLLGKWQCCGQAPSSSWRVTARWQGAVLCQILLLVSRVVCCCERTLSLCVWTWKRADACVCSCWCSTSCNVAIALLIWLQFNIVESEVNLIMFMQLCFG